jgi:hypothetical protein
MPSGRRVEEVTVSIFEMSNLFERGSKLHTAIAKDQL